MLHSDLVTLYRVASDPLIWEQHHSKRYIRDEFEAFFAESLQSGGALTILDQRSKQIIGSSRYNFISGAPEAVEIGWSFLGRDYWGGKYNGECKRLMIEHAFQEREWVVFYVHMNNRRSQKAVAKVGGVKTSTGQNPELMIKGDDYYVYVIRRSQSSQGEIDV